MLPRFLKRTIRDFLERRKIFLFTSRSLPRNVRLDCDLARFLPLENFGVVFDVGANVGQTALTFLGHFPRSTVYSFEPVQATYEKLIARVGAEPRVRCERVALGNQSGKGIMVWEDNSFISHLRPLSDGALQPESEEEVTVDCLDDYCSRNSISHIDLLKSDTEGHDMDVFEGAKGLLDRGAISFIYVEVGFSSSNHSQTHLGLVFDHLSRKDFIFYGLYDPRDALRQTDLIWADALFVHKSMLPSIR